MRTFQRIRPLTPDSDFKRLSATTPASRKILCSSYMPATGEAIVVDDQVPIEPSELFMVKVVPDMV